MGKKRTGALFYKKVAGVLFLLLPDPFSSSLMLSQWGWLFLGGERGKKPGEKMEGLRGERKPNQLCIDIVEHTVGINPEACRGKQRGLLLAYLLACYLKRRRIIMIILGESVVSVSPGEIRRSPLLCLVSQLFSYWTWWPENAVESYLTTSLFYFNRLSYWMMMEMQITLNYYLCRRAWVYSYIQKGSLTSWSDFVGQCWATISCIINHHD